MTDEKKKDDDDDDEDDLVTCAKPGCGVEFELSQNYTGDRTKALCRKCLKIKREAKVARKDNVEKPAAAAKAVGVGAVAAGVAAAVSGKGAVKEGVGVLGTLGVRKATRWLAEHAPEAYIRWVDKKTNGGEALEESAAFVVWLLDLVDVLPEGVQSMVNDFVIDFAAGIKERIQRGGLTPEIKQAATTAIDALKAKIAASEKEIKSEDVWVVTDEGQKITMHPEACLRLDRERPAKVVKNVTVDPGVHHRKMTYHEAELQGAEANCDGCERLAAEKLVGIQNKQTDLQKLKESLKELEETMDDGKKRAEKLSFVALQQRATDQFGEGKPGLSDSFERLFTYVSLFDADEQIELTEKLIAYVHRPEEVTALGRANMTKEQFEAVLEGCRDPDEKEVREDWNKVKEFAGKTVDKTKEFVVAADKRSGVPAALTAGARGLRALAERFRIRNGG